MCRILGKAGSPRKRSNVQLFNHKYICRYRNEPHAELAIAAAEQMKITELRLRKLLADRSPSASASRDGPVAVVMRRAGLLKAQLGAYALVGTSMA